MGLLRYVLRRLAGPGRRVRVVRRLEMRCPHSAETAEIDLLMGPTGRPSMVLRCSRQPKAPPTCDQLCRTRAEAVTTTPRSLLMVQPGEGPPDERD